MIFIGNNDHCLGRSYNSLFLVGSNKYATAHRVPIAFTIENGDSNYRKVL